MSRLNGKIAVITGGNSGIGLATAIRFAAEGAQVVIVGRRQEELDKALRLIGPEAIAIQGDISNLGDLERIFTQIKADKGKAELTCCSPMQAWVTSSQSAQSLKNPLIVHSVSTSKARCSPYKKPWR